MRQEIKITKILMIYMAILLGIVFMVNYNMEKGSITLQSPFISNNLVFSLISGICTGFITVIIANLYKYHLDKREKRENIYVFLRSLYYELYYWKCNIEEIDTKNDVNGTVNFFESVWTKVEYLKNNLYNIGYCSFFYKDKIERIYENSLNEYLEKIPEINLTLKYYNCAVPTDKINEISNIKDVKTSFQILSILNKQLVNNINSLDEIIERFEKELKKERWKMDKTIIHNNYININSLDLDTFIKKNSTNKEESLHK